MKKIILSLAIVSAAAAIVIGGSIAYFSDTETSTGNTFTAGAIDLKIDNESYVTNEYGVLVESPNNTWGLDDLDSQLFFSFADLKPGDIGEDTISIHVDNNDAWACMNIDITGTPENGITEPEGIVDSSGGTNEGELQDELNFVFWADDGDNVLEIDEEIITQGTAASLFDGTNIALADSQHSNLWDQNGPLQGGGDTVPYVYHVGKVWCYGELEKTPFPQGDDTSPLVRGTGFDCDGADVTNISQTDGIMADVTFYAEQSRNNPNFTCQAPRPLIGANLGRHTQASSCDSTVGSSGTIQAAVDAASAGQTICVEAGTYDEDVVINKSLTLSGDGAGATSVINGQSTAYVGAVTVANGVTNVTIEGFEINGAGQAAVYLIGNNSGITVRSNKLVSPSGTQKNAFLSGGLQTNNTITNNELVGNSASQLAYVNGRASLNVASDNVDFTYNTFSGTIISGGVALGNEAGNSDITRNVFESTLTSTYTIVEAWQDGIVVNENNFNGTGGTKVTRSSNGNTGIAITDAEDNWWGDNNPSDNVSANVDYDPWESSAYPEN